ncbi:hypothetical protein X975_13580, partial [Stegodyphus mimosarum]
MDFSLSIPPNLLDSFPSNLLPPSSSLLRKLIANPKTECIKSGFSKHFFNSHHRVQIP